MGRRIESVTSREFDALFTSFEHTAYRLETLQVYDVSYEVEPYQAFISGHPQPHDPAKNAWVSMIKDAVQAGKIFQRVHIVAEPLTDYLRYELGWSYPPNVDVRRGHPHPADPARPMAAPAAARLLAIRFQRPVGHGICRGRRVPVDRTGRRPCRDRQTRLLA